MGPPPKDGILNAGAFKSLLPPSCYHPTIAGGMRIGFFTDTHLGATLYRGGRGWRTKEKDIASVRKGDIYESFKAALDLFLEEKPDIVAHLGDLLEGRASATIFNDLNTAINGLKTLLDAGIKVILLEGNHDFRRYADRKNQPFTVIETALKPYTNRGDLVIVRAEEYRIIDGWARVPIVAVGYYDEGDNFVSLSNTLRKAAEELNGRKALLLTHQTIGDVWGIPEFYRIEDIPDNFVYIFNGHIHKRKLVVRPPRIFVNPGSVEYQDMGEAWDVFELLRIYEDLEGTYGRKKALEMFKRAVMKGVVFLDLDAPQLRNLMDPEDANIKGDDIPVYYWNSSRRPVFYHPLPTSRPFLKARVREGEEDTFNEAIDKLLDVFKALGVKAPVLSLEAEMGEETFARFQARLIDLLEGDELAALRILYEALLEREEVSQEFEEGDRYALFGEYGHVLRMIDEKVRRLIDLEGELKEIKGKKAKGEKEREITSLTEKIKEEILSAFEKEVGDA